VFDWGDLMGLVPMEEVARTMQFGSIKICSDDLERLSKLADVEDDTDLSVISRVLIDILHELDRQDSYDLEQFERNA
jgi:hypothetical protein